MATTALTIRSDRFPLQPLLPSPGYRIDSVDTRFHIVPIVIIFLILLNGSVFWLTRSPKSRKTKEERRASQKRLS